MGGPLGCPGPTLHRKTFHRFSKSKGGGDTSEPESRYHRPQARSHTTYAHCLGSHGTLLFVQPTIRTMLEYPSLPQIAAFGRQACNLQNGRGMARNHARKGRKHDLYSYPRPWMCHARRVTTPQLNVHIHHPFLRPPQGCQRYCWSSVEVNMEIQAIPTQGYPLLQTAIITTHTHTHTHTSSTVFLLDSSCCTRVRTWSRLQPHPAGRRELRHWEPNRWLYNYYTLAAVPRARHRVRPCN
ncbi:hypothetical protein LX36DRAFT_119427 [Colletotrichum falcatum]|nr:hypothetical protein LX36DRAFT_119427 [Colletotrichum falcatum]